MSDSGLIIRGEVRDQAGVPIFNARVWISSGPVAVADVAMLTDTDGEFLLSVPAVGRYEIACAADEFHPVRQVMEVSGKDAVSIELRLKKSF